MEYKVIYFVRCSESEAINALEKKVTELLSNGWQTQGGISVIQDSSDFYHAYQSMLK